MVVSGVFLMTMTLQRGFRTVVYFEIFMLWFDKMDTLMKILYIVYICLCDLDIMNYKFNRMESLCSLRLRLSFFAAFPLIWKTNSSSSTSTSIPYRKLLTITLRHMRLFHFSFIRFSSSVHGFSELVLGIVVFCFPHKAPFPFQQPLFLFLRVLYTLNKCNNNKSQNVNAQGSAALQFWGR